MSVNMSPNDWYLFPILCLVCTQILFTNCVYEPMVSPKKGFVLESRTGQVFRMKVGNTTINVDQRTHQSCDPKPILGFKFLELTPFADQCPSPDVPPLIEHNFKNITVESGEKIRFDVVFTGNPQPFVTFFKNGAQLSANERIHMLDNLYIENAVVEDSGVYTMLAHNPFGTDRIDFTVTVKPHLSHTTPPPHLCPPKVSAFADNLVIFNDSVRLIWIPVPVRNVEYKVELYDNTTQLWKPLATVSQSSIIIKKMRCFLWYRFRVTSRSNGCDGQPIVAKNVMVEYGVPEAIPNPITIAEMTANKMTIVWNPPLRECGSHIFEYVVEKQFLNSNDWRVVGKTVPNARQFTDTHIEGVFRYGIKAVNIFGESVPFVSTFINPSHMITRCPTLGQGLIQVSDVTRSSATLRWDHLVMDKETEATYQVETIRGGLPQWFVMGNTSIPQITITDLNCNTEYRFRVRVPACESLVLESKPVLTLGIPDPPVGPIKVDVVDGNRLIMYWLSPAPVCGLQVEGFIIEKQYKTSPDWMFVTRTSGNVNQFVDNNIANTYRYRIIAINSFGQSVPLMSEFLTPLELLTPPMPLSLIPNVVCPQRPQGLVEVSVISRNSVRLDWDQCIPEKSANGVRDTFQLEMMEVRAGQWTVLGNTTNYYIWINQLKCHTEYKFRVRVFTPGCETTVVESETTVTSGQPETPLRPIQVNVLNFETLTLSWTPPPVVCNTPVEGYIIEKQYNTSERWINLGEVPGNGYREMGIEKTYRFRIRAFNKFGESAPLVSKFVTPHEMLPKSPCPKKPEGEVEVVTVTRNSVQIFWGKNIVDKSGNYSFEIELSEANSGVWTHVGNTTSQQTLVNQLKCVTDYKLRVKVYTPGCDTVVLYTKSMTTPGTADSPPKPINVVVFAPDRLNMSWTPVTPVCGVPIDGYTVEKQYDNTDLWNFVGQTQESHFTDLNIEQTFRYKIKAVNKYGVSAPLISKHITPIAMWKAANEQ